jgi:hypothetical protein
LDSYPFITAAIMNAVAAAFALFVLKAMRERPKATTTASARDIPLGAPARDLR